MSLNNAREVLIAELLGEFDPLIQRVEGLQAQMTTAQAGLLASAAEVLASVETHRKSVQSLTEHAQRSAVNHIIERTNVVCEGKLAELTTAMHRAARTAFDAELGRRVDHLTSALKTREPAPPPVTPWRQRAAMVAAMLGSALCGSLLTILASRS
ncbi:hypothetical protein AACH06_25635 [Ideonella sp. DXS29W]|uniref:Conjugal transfer protein TraM n=1 Tax=Ideonella lacteola TaxID=2984193 RepID=A0ABU9BW72_9BURK